MTPAIGRQLLALCMTLGLFAAPPLQAQTADPTEPVTEPVPEPVTEPATPPDLPPPLPPEPEPVTPPPLPPQPEFFVDQGGTPGGPFKLADLQAQVVAGTLTPATLAWTAGMADWAPASTVAGLEALFASQTATPTDTVAPDMDVAALLVGNWTQTGPIEIPGVGPGNADISASFAADGRFTIAGTIEAINAETGSMTIEVAAEGNYAVQAQENGNFALTQTGSIRTTMPGFAPVDQAMAETTSYRMLDPDTIEDTTTGDRLIRQP